MSDVAPFVLSPVFGTQQSPINIIEDRCFHVDFKAPYLYRYAEVFGHIEKHDDAHYVFKVDEDCHKVDFEILPGITLKATLQQIHFHAPSEHAIDGRYRQGEFHFVHQISKLSNGAGEGQVEPSDLLAFGMLVEFTAAVTEEPDEKEFRHEIAKMVHKREASSGRIRFPHRPLMRLSDICRQGAYLYRGAVTSGEHQESVTWLVFKEVARLPVFEGIDLSVIKQPTRAIYPANRRIVLKNFRTEKSEEG